MVELRPARAVGTAGACITRWYFKDKIWVLGGQTLPPSRRGGTFLSRYLDQQRWRALGTGETAGALLVGARPDRRQRGLQGPHAGSSAADSTKRPGCRSGRSYNDVWSSADGVTWTRHLESAPWAARTYHSVAVFDDRMWVLAGFLDQGPGTSGNRNDVWYSSDGVEWTELPGTPWKGRHATSVFVYDNALWVMAGSHMSADVWKLVRRKPDRPEQWRPAISR